MTTIERWSEAVPLARPPPLVSFLPVQLSVASPGKRMAGHRRPRRPRRLGAPVPLQPAPR
jgi:hypothetical protein